MEKLAKMWDAMPMIAAGIYQGEFYPGNKAHGKNGWP
jgi:hypothetical protein